MEGGKKAKGYSFFFFCGGGVGVAVRGGGWMGINTNEKLDSFAGLMACLCHKLQSNQRAAPSSTYYFRPSVSKSH